MLGWTWLPFVFFYKSKPYFINTLWVEFNYIIRHVTYSKSTRAKCIYWIWSKLTCMPLLKIKQLTYCFLTADVFLEIDSGVWEICFCFKKKSKNIVFGKTIKCLNALHHCCSPCLRWTLSWSRWRRGRRRSERSWWTGGRWCPRHWTSRTFVGLMIGPSAHRCKIFGILCTRSL